MHGAPEKEQRCTACVVEQGLQDTSTRHPLQDEWRCYPDDLIRDPQDHGCGSLHQMASIVIPGSCVQPLEKRRRNVCSHTACMVLHRRSSAMLCSRVHSPWTREEEEGCLASVIPRIMVAGHYPMANILIPGIMSAAIRRMQYCGVRGTRNGNATPVHTLRVRIHRRRMLHTPRRV